MKYEEFYGTCWDYLFIDMGMGESIVELLGKYYEVEIIDREKFRISFFELIEKLHEMGVIKPRKLPDIEFLRKHNSINYG